MRLANLRCFSVCGQAVLVEFSFKATTHSTCMLSTSMVSGFANFLPNKVLLSQHTYQGAVQQWIGKIPSSHFCKHHTGIKVLMSAFVSVVNSQSSANHKSFLFPDQWVMDYSSSKGRRIQTNSVGCYISINWFVLKTHLSCNIRRELKQNKR